MSETLSRSDYAEALVQEFSRTCSRELIERILPLYSDLVERIARRYSGLDAQEDLVQVGYIGLLNALTLFEPSKGVRFNTYATHLVAGSIKHHLRDRAKIIREPAWLQEVRHKTNKVGAQLTHELGRVPTAEEIAEKGALPVETVREVLATDELFRVTSLAAQSNGDDDEAEHVDLADECRELLTLEDREVLERAILGLRELEQKVLFLFHFDSMNQTEIAARLGISGNYVSHIMRQALAKLRSSLAAEERLDRALQAQASQLQHDVVEESTGAYTEQYLLARLDEECSRAACNGESVAFAHIQFQGLDALRKFYGPDAVRQFLSDAADYIRSGVRRLDIVGRMGETGFGVVFPSTGNQVAVVQRRLAAKLLSWVSRGASGSAGVEVLIGGSHYPEHGRNSRQLASAARLEPLERKKAA